jgi:hypothetical protein
MYEENVKCCDGVSYVDNANVGPRRTRLEEDKREFIELIEKGKNIQIIVDYIIKSRSESFFVKPRE